MRTLMVGLVLLVGCSKTGATSSADAAPRLPEKVGGPEDLAMIRAAAPNSENIADGRAFAGIVDDDEGRVHFKGYYERDGSIGLGGAKFFAWALDHLTRATVVQGVPGSILLAQAKKVGNGALGAEVCVGARVVDIKLSSSPPGAGPRRDIAMGQVSDTVAISLVKFIALDSAPGIDERTSRAMFCGILGGFEQFTDLPVLWGYFVSRAEVKDPGLWDFIVDGPRK